ncbi:MarR family winged helix-turn-helix transcriptional regulator [Crossiella cryophila]|uniref:DNA-binding MarR family transcriptional regulator n=1 Tax=Crossiella cryophila TaxID=43355 RepID=A0A7W7CHC1_9PSEU|nr:MarR family transcriptional regulator [Crossiella cryophila]MBB4681265.1 DNA-binding MarR family transcriptional regulator [Crossiella cryophila]
MSRSQRKEDDPDLGILAGNILFGVQREMFRSLAEQGHPELRPRHGAVLAYLDENGSRATDLARQSGQHKQVIGTLVDELVALGYLRREPDPNDRRAKLILPTERGLDEMRRGDQIMAEIEARHRAEVGEQEYAAFKRCMTRIARLHRSSAED